MNLEDIEKQKAELGTILATMDLPEMRKKITFSNLRWLSRNMAIRNKNHPLFMAAKGIITSILRFSSKNT